MVAVMVVFMFVQSMAVYSIYPLDVMTVVCLVDLIVNYVGWLLGAEIQLTVGLN